MPNPKPNNGKPGRPFQKGQSGNPAGSSAISRELGNIRKLNQAQVSELLNRFVSMPLEDVVAFAQDKKNPSMEILVASVIIHGIKSGDHSRLTFLFDRLIGKVKEVHEHTFLGNLNAAIVDKITEIEKANATGGNYNGKKTNGESSEEERVRTEEGRSKTNGQEVGSEEEVKLENCF